MDRDEIIHRLKKIADHATHIVGEPPLILSLDDGIALHDAVALLKEPERKSGEWIDIWDWNDPDTSSEGRCSVCGRKSRRPLGRFCKWCGARMDLEVQE